MASPGEMRSSDAPDVRVSVELEASLSPFPRDKTINRLPSDIFGQIFQLLDMLDTIRVYHRLTSLSAKDLGAYSWLRLSLVCRRWYQECVNCTPLWRIILLPGIQSEAFLRLCLRRSRGRPLLVSYSDPENLNDDRAPPSSEGMAGTRGLSASDAAMFELAMAEADRIEELYLVMPHVNGWLMALLARVGPGLLRCSLQSSRKDQNRDPQGFSHDYEPNFPRLQRLALHRPFVLAWDCLARMSARLPKRLCHCAVSYSCHFAFGK